MKIEIFTKNFFPKMARDDPAKKSYDFSDSEDSEKEAQPKSKSPFGRRDT